MLVILETSTWLSDLAGNRQWPSVSHVIPGIFLPIPYSPQISSFHLSLPRWSFLPDILLYWKVTQGNSMGILWEFSWNINWNWWRWHVFCPEAVEGFLGSCCDLGTSLFQAPWFCCCRWWCSNFDLAEHESLRIFAIYVLYLEMVSNPERERKNLQPAMTEKTSEKLEAALRWGGDFEQCLLDTEVLTSDRCWQGNWLPTVWWIFRSPKTTKLEATDRRVLKALSNWQWICSNALMRYWPIKQRWLLFYTFLDSLESSLTSPPRSLFSWFSCCQFCPLPHSHACHDPPHAISRTQKGAWLKDSHGSVAGLFCGLFVIHKMQWMVDTNRLKHRSKTSSCLHYENWMTTDDKSSGLIARKRFSLSRNILLIW